MKLKNIVAICLMLYIGVTVTIIVVGLWVAPGTVKNSTNGSNTAKVATTKDTTTANPQPTQATPSSSASSGATSSTSTAGTATAPKTSSSSSASSGGSTPAPAPTPSPSPGPTCGAPGGSCSAAQVAAHSSKTDCWVIYNGSYYIVTSYVNSHPGGQAVFNSNTCGHDITSYLNGSASSAGQRHSHSSSAYAVLNSYFIGPVK